MKKQIFPLIIFGEIFADIELDPFVSQVTRCVRIVLSLSVLTVLAVGDVENSSKTSGPGGGAVGQHV